MIYLREWRKYRGFSGEKLGELSGVSPGQISLIERKLSAGSPETLEKLADALGITLGQLFEPPPKQGEIVVRAKIREDQREQYKKLLNLIEGEDFTKT